MLFGWNGMPEQYIEWMVGWEHERKGTVKEKRKWILDIYLKIDKNTMACMQTMNSVQEYTRHPGTNRKQSAMFLTLPSLNPTDLLDLFWQVNRRNTSLGFEQIINGYFQKEETNKSDKSRMCLCMRARVCVPWVQISLGTGYCHDHVAPAWQEADETMKWGGCVEEVRSMRWRSEEDALKKCGGSVEEIKIR